MERIIGRYRHGVRFSNGRMFVVTASDFLDAIDAAIIICNATRGDSPAVGRRDVSYVELLCDAYYGDETYEW